MKKYSVYVLVKDKKAVYVGCTSNIKNRIYNHSKNKDFDNYFILKSYKIKKEALAAENAIITFLTLFGDGNWYNSENILLSYIRENEIRY